MARPKSPSRRDRQNVTVAFHDELLVALDDHVGLVNQYLNRSHALNVALRQLLDGDYEDLPNGGAPSKVNRVPISVTIDRGLLEELDEQVGMLNRFADRTHAFNRALRGFLLQSPD